MEEFQESLSPSTSLSLSSTSSSPILHPSSPSSLSFSSCSISSSQSHPLSIDAELWLMAEQRIQEILCIIQPALVSEERRKSIVGYFQRLIKGYYGIEVLPFGSVPLKTFLPDGDIDLTALSHRKAEQKELARDICSILQNDRQDSEFLVQDVQYISAQVKIVKCTVNNIPVDISFNQTAGLSALCFLEKVDQFVAKDHLFKCSIILIKAWCYYESRILGAHHGLISTYALETLILYIINIFHSSLCGPLAVLYKFLDYYSTFDWENYCVSINGPVPLSSPSAVVAESPENDGDEPLLSQDFLRHCREMFSVPMQSLEIGAHAFPIKHLNIVDPLNENNNLGRSVGKGNFYRIRSALSFGAQRLREILMLPGENMGRGLENFFINTLGRNGRGQRPDVQIPVPAFGTGRSEESDLSGDYDGYYNGLIYSQRYHNNDLPATAQPSSVSSSSQTQKKSTWEALRQFVRCKRNIFYWKATNVIIPSLSFSHPCAPQLPAATFGIDKMAKSRGTGTYIPDMTHQSYRDMQSWTNQSYRDVKSWTHQSYRDMQSWTHQSYRDAQSWTHQSHRDTQSWVSTRNPKSATPGLLQNSPKETNANENSLDENSLETDHSGNGGSLDFDFTPEEFPLLPGTERTMTTHQSSQPAVKCPQAENCSGSLPGIKFGNFECSTPMGMHSPLPEQTDSRVRMPTTEKQKQKELCEFNEGRFLVKPLQLEDNDDFPPLLSM
ncbi:PREDICTED: uncharacterized protein LOC18587491 isoform X1 [Theobroma cacao]|uniref:Uncharacterized protein LOC18587491 isoform X1 n=1 Tax=Theobroma cacao TaxID=3641 RepID=A0AB32UMY3_THECC|nr:PREDICTED: uncharacterized protein LOC18587491 isoform X1 [Theobroma cacao]